MTDYDRLNGIARDLGYIGAKPQPNLSKRGRPAVNLTLMLVELFEAGFQYDRNFMEGTATPGIVPFLGDPHPDFPRVNRYLLRLDPNGQPDYRSRAELIRYLRQMTRKLNKPVSRRVVAKQLAEENRRRRIEESVAFWRAEIAVLEARRAKLVALLPSAMNMRRLEVEHQIRKTDLKLEMLKTRIDMKITKPTASAYNNARKVEIRRAKRVLQSGKPAKLPDGHYLEPEDAQWLLKNVKIGRPMVPQPSRQTLYMRKYREKLRQQAQNPKTETQP